TEQLGAALSRRPDPRKFRVWRSGSPGWVDADQAHELKVFLSLDQKSSSSFVSAGMVDQLPVKATRADPLIKAALITVIALAAAFLVFLLLLMALFGGCISGGSCP